jgi:nitroreductase
MKTLEELVDMARVTPSASNLQPLKYILSNTPEKNAAIFANLMWARYLRPWMGPDEGERPAGYIIILGDKEVTQNFTCDHGIAAQTIKLGAWEKGWAGCIFMAIRKKELAEALKIPEQYEILLVVALGKAKEKVVMDEIEPGGDIKYWRDKNDVHHVPKRKLKDIILE